MEEKTVRVVVRVLREAKLFTTGARGVNAPDNTTLDAVRVIIALVASSSPSRAAKDVNFFGNLVPDLRGPMRYSFANAQVDQDKTLEQTLVDCAERRLVFAEVPAFGDLCLSEAGEATLQLDDVDLEYHDRATWKGWMAGDLDVNDTEIVERIFSTKIRRSARVELAVIQQICGAMQSDEMD